MTPSPPIEGKPTDDDLQLICKKLLPVLMDVPYDQLGGTHSLVGILTDAKRYAADHGGATFVRPLRLPLYNATIADDATTVICVCAESAHQAKLDDYASFEAAKRGAAKFLREVIDEVWYNNLKDANTFYTKLTAREIILFLDANCRGLHAIDMISLRTNMHNYYTQADDIVGTLKNGYIRKVPLPRIPRIQSPSALVANVATATSNSHDTCYLQVPRVPTWSDIWRSLSGLGQSSLRPFLPVWLM
jgi:hypothetical protein